MPTGHITTCHPRFLDLPPSLSLIKLHNYKIKTYKCKVCTNLKIQKIKVSSKIVSAPEPVPRLDIGFSLG